MCVRHTLDIAIDTPTWKKCVYCDNFGVSTHFIFYSVMLIVQTAFSGSLYFLTAALIGYKIFLVFNGYTC